ncbi:MAG: diadenylate cyclase CdaA, partial [Bacteroidales bacterium]|nr:diadenylate cyclase CdaA [Bacteroidales bacterium]
MISLALFGFLNMTVADILDILLVAVIIYVAFRWIRGSSAMSIFIAVISLYIIRVIVSALNMRMMNAMMETLLGVGVLALIVIFQPELRRVLIRLGNQYRKASKNKFLGKIFGSADQELAAEAVREITDACRRMSESKTGALIVIPHTNPLEEIISTGDIIDAKVNRRLIQNLFFKNSPLHDGAVIINSERIVAARCTLPITQKTDIPASFGMRHKAAIGLTEETDADVILVSEETGHIAFVRAGEVAILDNIN